MTNNDFTSGLEISIRRTISKVLNEWDIGKAYLNSPAGRYDIISSLRDITETITDEIEALPKEGNVLKAIRSKK